MKKGKKFWLSKTFWVNTLACGAAVYQYFTGSIFEPETQVIALGFINMVLRVTTKEPVTWE